MIEYKAEGSIEIERDEERGTSSTCPKCNHRYHPSGRTFLCPNCGWSGHRDLVGSGNQLGRHEPHADVAALIEQAHPKYLRPWQQGRSSVDETDRPTGKPLTRPEKVALDKAIGSGWAALENRSREAAAQPCVVRGKSCNKAGSEHVSPRTPALQSWGVSAISYQSVCFSTGRVVSEGSTYWPMAQKWNRSLWLPNSPQILIRIYFSVYIQLS